MVTKAQIEDARKALQCLALQVPQSVHRDVMKKVGPILDAAVARSASPIQWSRKLAEYREIACALGTPIPRLFSKTSRAAYRSRASELGADWWDLAMVELRQVNTFCTGDNERGWRINLKYILSAAGSEKLLDGEWRRVADASEPTGPRSLSDLFSEEGE